MKHSPGREVAVSPHPETTTMLVPLGRLGDDPVRYSLSTHLPDPKGTAPFNFQREQYTLIYYICVYFFLELAGRHIQKTSSNFFSQQ